MSQNAFGVAAIIVGILTIFCIFSKQQKLPAVPKWLCITLVVACILGIYFAPYGFDRYQYKFYFLNPGEWNTKDTGWETYNSFFRFLFGSNADFFFLANACIYTLLFYGFAVRMIPRGNVFYFLLLLYISIGFYSGGTNVMRTGMATALVYFGLSRFDSKIWFVIFATLAYSIHASAAMMIIALVIGYYFPKNRLFFFIWLACLLGSNTPKLEQLLQPLLSLSDDTLRLEGYLNSDADNATLYSKTGWRLDFIIYSAIPLLFAWFYMTKCKYRDRFYSMVVSAYLICNSFWLCVIKMPFTDRIALLSWVFIPIVCSYPLLNDKKNIPYKNLIMSASLAIPVALQILFLS